MSCFSFSNYFTGFPNVPVLLVGLLNHPTKGKLLCWVGQMAHYHVLADIIRQPKQVRPLLLSLASHLTYTPLGGTLSRGSGSVAESVIYMLNVNLVWIIQVPPVRFPLCTSVLFNISLHCPSTHTFVLVLYSLSFTLETKNFDSDIFNLVAHTQLLVTKSN